MKESNPTTRISILSMQRVVNYGSVLQAYSLRELIQEIVDASVTFLDIEEHPSLHSRRTVKNSVDYEVPAIYPPGIAQKVKRWTIARLSAWNKKLIHNFMETELKLSEKAKDDEFDCVVVGSDEVFNHKKGICLQLHGQVKQAQKVITYAASCGSALVDDVYPEDRETLRGIMSNFAAVSVRDQETLQYTSSFYDGTIERHLDPVLVGNLHQREHKPVRLKKYLLVYAYGQRIRSAEEIKMIQAFAKARGLKTVAMGGSQFWCDLYIPASPFRMLDYFWYADYVVTDTFHGTIFSVINRKKFAVLVRKTNHNKLTSLLQDLGLECRLVTDLNRMEYILSNEIDYTAVDAILEHERIRARAYLLKQLEG